MTAAPNLLPDYDERLCNDRLLTGRVRLREGDSFSVAIEHEPGAWRPSELTAPRAASCLLTPEPGDRVLVACAPEPFILAVLERDERVAARVEFAGDATLCSRSGHLDLAGREGVRVTAGKAIALLSKTLSVKTGRAEIFAEKLTSVAKTVVAKVDQLGLVARNYDLVAERITQRAARAYRFIAELDQLRARHFDYRAEHSAQLKGETTVLTARQVIKVDGEQVHIG
ncbi:MAG: hypothetical protein DRI90_27570 [Deltaproteobacteria bacterium]|nr:MAG: hypothetical protein DRI90_27570 [Deltaproteobacteria bacterium]